MLMDIRFGFGDSGLFNSPIGESNFYSVLIDMIVGPAHAVSSDYEAKARNYLCFVSFANALCIRR